MIWCLQKEIKQCLTWKLHGLSYTFLAEYYDFNIFISSLILTSSKPSYFIIQSFLNLYLLQWFFPTIFAAPWLWILFKQLVHFKTASATSIWGKRVSFFVWLAFGVLPIFRSKIFSLSQVHVVCLLLQHLAFANLPFSKVYNGFDSLLNEHSYFYATAIANTQNNCININLFIHNFYMKIKTLI